MWSGVQGDLAEKELQKPVLKVEGESPGHGVVVKPRQVSRFLSGLRDGGGVGSVWLEPRRQRAQWREMLSRKWAGAGSPGQGRVSHFPQERWEPQKGCRGL